MLIGRMFAAFLHFESVQLVCNDAARLRHPGRAVEFRGVEIKQSFLIQTVNGYRLDSQKFQAIETRRYMNG